VAIFYNIRTRNDPKGFKKVNKVYISGKRAQLPHEYPSFVKVRGVSFLLRSFLSLLAINFPSEYIMFFDVENFPERFIFVKEHKGVAFGQVVVLSSQKIDFFDPSKLGEIIFEIFFLDIETESTSK